MGKSYDEAGAAALLTMLCHAADTNMIHRSSIDSFNCETKKLQELLASNPFPNKNAL